jgi:hypothetical protein
MALGESPEKINENVVSNVFAVGKRPALAQRAPLAEQEQQQHEKSKKN